MFLKPEQQLERCRRVIRQRVEPHIHLVLAHLGVEAFDIPGEPMPHTEFFAREHAGDIPFEPFTMGSAWGTTWGTVWFRITGRIPADRPEGMPLELMLDLGWYEHSCGGHIEGLVYRPDGTAVKAVHPLNHWVPFMDADGAALFPIDDDGSFTLYLEAASNPLLLGVPPFIETELGDHATGRPDEPYVFRAADLTVYDRRYDLYRVDLDVAASLMELADKETPRYWRLAKALQRSMNVFDEQAPDTVVAAREALAGVLSSPAGASSMRVGAIGHAHIDSAWLWPVRETRRKVARTVSNALALMDADPDFKYAMSSAQQYAWLEQDHPDIFARMKARIDEGRFIPVGGMWVEADGMLPCGESLIRQVSYGRRYFKEKLGVEPKGIWLPDSFGYTGAWPQIARRAGYEWFLTQKISWSDTTKFPHHSFMWQGIDGTPIFTHFPPSDTYAAWATAKELDYAERNFRDKDLTDRSLMLFGFGDGGGGPTRNMMDHLHRFGNVEGVSRVAIETPDDFFADARADLEAEAGVEMPTYKGELYLELHRGTLTAQQAMKRGCRAEESLLRTVEYLGAAAVLADPEYVYPREEMDRIWTTLLLNQFHDILPGSSISWVHREAREDYERDLARLGEIAAEAIEAIAAANPDAARIARARISQYAEVGAWRPASLEAEGEAVTAERGEDGSVTLDNGLLHVVVAADGTVSSMTDLATGREMVAKDAALGRYEILKDEPGVFDAWDVERDAFLCATALTDGEIAAVEIAADGTAVVRTVNRWREDEIATTISLRPGKAQLDFHADVDWNVPEKLLKVDVPMALTATRAQYECQYGLIERPIVKNTEGDEAMFESCSHRFIRIHDSSYGIGVANGSTYGSDVSSLRDADGAIAGTMVRMSLVAAPTAPDPRTDIGRHEFDWTVLPCAEVAPLVAAAGEINAPVLEGMPDIAAPVSIETTEGTMSVDWIKLADDGSGDVVVRLYEAAGAKAEAVLHVEGPLAGWTVRETNTLEQDESYPDEPAGLVGEGRQDAEGARLSLRPFQLTTLRLTRA